MENFSERLKELRKFKEKTQREISISLGITERNYQSYEAGGHKPNLGTAIAIADLFGVSLDYLVGRSNDRKLHDPVPAEEGQSKTVT